MTILSFSKACSVASISLRSNLTRSVVQGYSFTFLPRPDGDMELNNIVYFRPTIDDASPLRAPRPSCSSNTKPRATACFARRRCDEYSMLSSR